MNLSLRHAQIVNHESRSGMLNSAMTHANQLRSTCCRDKVADRPINDAKTMVSYLSGCLHLTVQRHGCDIVSCELTVSATGRHWTLRAYSLSGDTNKGVTGKGGSSHFFQFVQFSQFPGFRDFGAIWGRLMIFEDFGRSRSCQVSILPGKMVLEKSEIFRNPQKSSIDPR